MNAQTRPELAQLFVGLGVDLTRVRVHQNLRQALKACMGDSRSAGLGSRAT